MLMTMRSQPSLPVFLLSGLLLLAGCASNDDGGAKPMKTGWPSLAPRVGEVSPLVPRVPLGSCLGCGPDETEASAPSLPAMADLPAPVRAVLPADIENQLGLIDAVISRIEAAAPAARQAAREAIAAAGPGAMETEADVQASRFEALFQPLGPQDAALVVLEAALPDADGGSAYVHTIGALRKRLAALETVRADGLIE